MAYALKLGGKVVPLTGLIDPKVLIEGGRNTIVYERDEQLRQAPQAVRDQPLAESSIGSLQDLLCCLPQVEAPEPRLQERVPRHHHAVHRRPRVRRALGEEELRAHRASGGG